MSAREELLRNLRRYEPREEVTDDPAAQMLDAFRAEVLREVRKEILEASLATPDLKARELWKSGYKAGLSMAAVICTPDAP